MLENDILCAQQIIEGTNKKNVKTFHNNSFIYKRTTENISLYKNKLKNIKDLLTVTASGDQALNALLFDSYNIDTFDISSFPRYYLNLKVAAIEALSREEYIKFFCDSSYEDEELLNDIYSLIRIYLDKDTKKFWDSLFNFYEIETVFESSLFCRQYVSEDKTIKYNPYMELYNYNLLKSKIGKLNLRNFVSNINGFKSDKKYDLILMSNIIDYVEDYENILEHLPLKDNGEALTYLFYNIGDRNISSNCHIKGHVMVYKK